ncbi:MAG: head GIN domain-containing protein [Bacteroidales bacterium]
MKSKFYAVVTVTLFLAMFDASAQRSVIVDAKGFSGVENSISANVNVFQAAEYKVEVIAPQDVIDALKIYVEDGTLRLKTKNRVNWSNSWEKIVVNVWSPNFSHLALNGSGDIIAKTPITAKEFSIKINGSGDVKIESLEASSLVVKSNGSGDVLLGGKNVLDSAEYSVNGSGDIDAMQLSCKKVDANVTGSGDIDVWATEAFNAKIVGSGDIELKGNPTIDAKVVGSGNVKRK